MSRRVIMPTADDLFRPTVVPAPDVADAEPPRPEDGGVAEKAPSGRVRHDEKMTVYVTADELLDIEHARLDLRRHHGLAVDRGRLVRAAVALALADLEENGDDSVLLRRLLTTPRGA
ncbi:MAG: hypothetical protein ACRDPI_03620 [Nocardioidaceae bacterium]